MRSTIHVPKPFTCDIPTVNDGADYGKLFSLWQKVQKYQPSTVIFEFSRCHFLRQNAVAFLGGMARQIQHNGGQVDFAWHTLQDDIHMNLQQNSFYATMEGKTGGWKGNSIPCREDPENDPASISNYLEGRWLGPDWVDVADDIKHEIICTVQEIYSNAFEHGESSIGVVSCGQHYPNRQRLELTVVDFGVGIPFRVREFLNKPQKPVKQALEWAFMPGTSTRPGNIPGGIGLDTLKRFLQEKQGRMTVYSGGSHAVITRSHQRFSDAPVHFHGTLMNISIKSDISCYT